MLTSETLREKGIEAFDGLYVKKYLASCGLMGIVVECRPLDGEERCCYRLVVNEHNNDDVWIHFVIFSYKKNDTLLVNMSSVNLSDHSESVDWPHSPIDQSSAPHQKCEDLRELINFLKRVE